MDYARIEIANKTNFVNELYYSDASKDDEITSNSYREFSKSTFYIPIDEKLEAIHTDQTSTFKVKVSYDELLYINCRIELPTLKVKEEYKDTVKIAWGHNLGHNIIRNARFYIDGKEYQRFDKIDLDILYQFEIPNDRKQHYKERIGSVPCLEDWSLHLPRYKLNVPQPFYFCKDISQNIPLKIFNVKEANFIYEFTLDIWKLLRVSIFSSKTNSWQELKNLNKTKLEAFVTGLNTSATLPYPELFGRYVILTDEERNWRSSCLSKQVYYIDQMVDSSPTNQYALTQTSETKLVSNSPCKKVYWMAENAGNKDFNIFSNYTTCREHLKGYNPCSTATMKYGQIIRFHLEQDVFDHQMTDKHCIGTPNETGYNIYSFCYDNSTFDADVGMSFNPPNNTPTLSIMIADTDPYKEEIKKFEKKLNKDDIEEMLGDQETLDLSNVSSKDLYYVHVRLLTYRRVKFEKNDKGEIVLTIDN
jgi:hypothetical protein